MADQGASKRRFIYSEIIIDKEVESYRYSYCSGVFKFSCCTRRDKGIRS